jgi:hypothetical protein
MFFSGTWEATITILPFSPLSLALQPKFYVSKQMLDLTDIKYTIVMRYYKLWF